MNKTFRKQIDACKRGQLIEHLHLFGDTDTMPQTAIPVDWLHVLLCATTDLAETLRITQPEEEAHVRKARRKHLALIVATCETWERRL